MKRSFKCDQCGSILKDRTMTFCSDHCKDKYNSYSVTGEYIRDLHSGPEQTPDWKYFVCQPYDGTNEKYLDRIKAGRLRR